MTQMPLEGDAFSKLNALFTEGTNAADRAAKIEIATVTSSAPNLEIKLDADGLVLDKDVLVVAEHLTQHERIVSIEHVESEQRDLGGKVVTNTSTPNMASYTLNYVKMTFEDELKVGDRVLVACLDVDMTYIILDRARWY